jgi:hypothetical protein
MGHPGLVVRTDPRLETLHRFRPMYAAANIEGHPSREEGFVHLTSQYESVNQNRFFPASHSSLPGRKFLFALCDTCLHIALCIQHSRLLEE